MTKGSKTKSKSMKAQLTRTTLSIDNDVMLLLRQQAAASGQSLGKTASRIIRQAVTATDGEPRYYNGIRLFPRGLELRPLQWNSSINLEMRHIRV